MSDDQCGYRGARHCALPALRTVAGGMLALALIGMSVSSMAKPRPVEPEPAKSMGGETIYLRGVLASGAPVAGTRAGGEPVTGEQAACVNCHRRSGLGSQESRSNIPPITGEFLFHSKVRDTENPQLPYIPGARLQRTPLMGAGVGRRGDVGEGAAQALSQSVQKLHFAVANQELPPWRTMRAERATSAAPGNMSELPQARIELQAALIGLRPQDFLMLWLRSPDVASPGPARAVPVSNWAPATSSA